MPREPHNRRTGLWLACGGLVILAAHSALAVYESSMSYDALMLVAGSMAGYLITAVGIGLCLSGGYREWSRGGTANRNGYALVSGATDDASASEDTQRLTMTFLDWLSDERLPGTLWKSFDQLVREMLTEQLGAARIRCYNIAHDSEQLRSLSQIGSETEGQCGRSGILGHVATTGHEFFAADPAHGQAVHELAADGGENWEWAFPVRYRTQTIGLVALGKIPLATRLDEARRNEIRLLISSFWQHVACMERLQVAETTDKASGLLTRSDFFGFASRALNDSYTENEPVVVIVLALEGLRRLDDLGRWSDRDTLIENIGQLVNRRIRSDDAIGRFSDDRFVLLLRRLDSSLGKIVASKIRDSAQQEVLEFIDGGASDEANATVRVRAGVSGSGFGAPPLDELLVDAFSAVDAARQQNLPIFCDLSNETTEAPARPATLPTNVTAAPAAKGEA